MKRALFRFGLLLPVLLGCAQRDTGAGDFKTVTSKEGRFTAEFPGDPTPSERIVKTPTGNLTIHSLMLRVGNAVEYLIAFDDGPAPLSEKQVQAFNADTALNGVRDSIVRSTRSRLLNETKIALDQWPGREWELDGPVDTNEDFRWRCYYVNARQYQIGVGWLKGQKPPTEIVDRFLNSLQVSDE
jgi:hypothetical protein